VIWFDIVTPKAVLFFIPIIKRIKQKGRHVLITTRESNGYTEVVELLKLYKVKFFNIGSFGGSELRSKLAASLERQIALSEFIKNFDIKVLVSLCSVDANRVAFGLGISIINFYDIPLSDHKTNFKRALPQARLTLPLSKCVFHPFVVPKEVFLRMALEEDQIISYNFIDPVIWLKDFSPNKDYVKQFLGIEFDKPVIVIREEEYKASYVLKKVPVLYEALFELNKKIEADFVIIPRYESKYLKELFPWAIIPERKFIVQHLLAFADLFIGGGGTMNIEATYFGTPTISTRSFVSHYDKYVINKRLMTWAQTKEEVIKNVMQMLGKRNNKHAKEIYEKMEVDLSLFTDNIIECTHFKKLKKKIKIISTPYKSKKANSVKEIYHS